MSSGRRRLQLDAGWHLVGAWLSRVCRRRWEDGRAEDPALPPKGRGGSKML